MTDDTWSDPTEIVPMFGAYDWRKYTQHGPFFLCLDGKPLEARGRYGNDWRVCAAEESDAQEIHVFAEAVSQAIYRARESRPPSEA